MAQPTWTWPEAPVATALRVFGSSHVSMAVSHYLRVCLSDFVHAALCVLFSHLFLANYQHKSQFRHHFLWETFLISLDLL